MKILGLLTGSGELPWSAPWQTIGSAQTAYGLASMAPEQTRLHDVRVVRINRHGVPHHIAPHAINYRANLSALAAQSVDAIVALNTVGGISAAAINGSIHLADQLIDYTWGRAQTFSPDDAVQHMDFSQPYDAALNADLAAAATAAGMKVVVGGTMAVTQGPRLETVAEVRRMAQDGCDLVGMTGMPEAALARELGIPFAAVCLVVNPAAGVASKERLDLQQMREVGRQGMARIGDLLLAFLKLAH